jgi:hypothetical protein
LRHGQQGGAHGHQPRHEHHHAAVSHAPGAAQRRRVLRIGPSSAGAWRTCPGTSFAVFGRIWGSCPLRHGLGSRRAETTQSDYGRHLGSVPMIVLFVPHAAG